MYIMQEFSQHLVGLVSTVKMLCSSTENNRSSSQEEVLPYLDYMYVGVVPQSSTQGPVPVKRWLEKSWVK